MLHFTWDTLYIEYGTKAGIVFFRLRETSSRTIMSEGADDHILCASNIFRGEKYKLSEF
jgi:hypothetical protein